MRACSDGGGVTNASSTVSRRVRNARGSTTSVVACARRRRRRRRVDRRRCLAARRDRCRRAPRQSRSPVAEARRRRDRRRGRAPDAAGWRARSSARRARPAASERAEIGRRRAAPPATRIIIAAAARSRSCPAASRGDVAVAGADPVVGAARSSRGTRMLWYCRRRRAARCSRARTGCSAPRRCAPSRRRDLRRALHDLGPAAALVGDLAQRRRVDAGVDRLPVRRVDRDRVDEGVAAQQRRAHLAQRGVAGRVGAVGDDQQRRALARARVAISGSDSTMAS